MKEVNGQQYQHATVVPVAKSSGGEFPFRTHRSVNRRHSVGSEATYDHQGQRDGFVFGQEEAELTVEMKFAEWKEFRQWLGDNSGTGAVVQCVFDMPVRYGNNVNSLEIVTAVSCHVTEEAVESSRDGGEIFVSVPIFVTTFDYGDRAPLISYE